VNHGKQFADLLDYLWGNRAAVEAEAKSTLIMVCEHGPHAHVVCHGRMYRYEEQTAHTAGPYTTAWSTCPFSAHRSRSFFTASNGGQVTPGACRMHPVQHDLKLSAGTLDALDAAKRVGGTPAVVAAMRKHARFDPLLWRLWDQVVWYQRAPRG
jgi:hypothetical protein